MVDDAVVEKIILLESPAGGGIGTNGSVELWAISDTEVSRDLTTQIHYSLPGVRVAVDAICVTPAHIQCYGYSLALAIRLASCEGTVTYDAAMHHPIDPHGDDWTVPPAVDQRVRVVFREATSMPCA
ncbi:MAG: hypothetical protein OXG17_04795 [Chloroflexi bacterium]|nr:hypothetical protein [Chloroflexota bacterium]